MLLSDVCLMSIRYMASASLVDMYIRHRSLQFHNMAILLGAGHTLGILRLKGSLYNVIHPRLDLVNIVVRPLLFTKLSLDKE